MTNRIDRLFESKKKDIFSIYFCAGTPSLDNTVDVIATLENNGVDMIEVGIPFSDPMADGVVIQDAATRALQNGMSLKLLFDQLSTVRSSGVAIPLLLMGYLNPIMQYGFENFCISCNKCGIDGVIIPDLPFDDYINEYKDTATKYGVHVIMLITPETTDCRIRLIDENCNGFIYMVSSAATTGSQSSFEEQKNSYFKRIAEMKLRNPRMIGFGISNKSTFDTACEYATGAIISSKFVGLLEEVGDARRAIASVWSAVGR